MDRGLSDLCIAPEAVMVVRRDSTRRARDPISPTTSGIARGPHASLEPSPVWASGMFTAKLGRIARRDREAVFARSTV
jgi:hypothetical protein